MLERFVDTSGWAALSDRREQHHARADALASEVWQRGGRLVTTNWALVELTALLTSPLRVSKPRQIQMLDDIRNDPGVFSQIIDASLETAAWQLWEARADRV